MSRVPSAVLLGMGSLAFLALSVTGFSQSDPATYRSYMTAAEALDHQDRFEAAEQQYAQALRSAVSSRARVEAQLAWAGLLSRNLGKRERAGQEAEKLYSSALTEAEGDLRLKAHNDFGVFLLRLGLAERSASILGQIESAAWPGADGQALRARLLYNYGQALERSNRPAEAYPRYLEAMRMDPHFSLARESALRIAEQLPSKPPLPSNPVLLVVQELLDQQNLADAVSVLRSLASAPDRLAARDSEIFTDLLLWYMTDARVGPDQFDSEWKATIAQLRGRLTSPASERLGHIHEAYLGNLSIETKPEAASANFRAWSGTDRQRSFSEFLKMVGDSYADKGDLRRSLERYSQAASLDPSNAEAALYMINLLHEYSDQLDPKGELLNRWLEETGGEPPSVAKPQDLEKLESLHSLLGSYFDEQKRWGPETDPKSSLFHWHHALRANDRIALLQAGGEGVRPVLHERLAAAYEHYGDPAQAAQEYRMAAVGYGRLDRVSKAQTLAFKAERLELDSRDTATGTTGTMILASETAAGTPIDVDVDWDDSDTDVDTGAAGMNETGWDSDYEDGDWGSLPATASLLPLLGLLGLSSLGLALVVRGFSVR